MDTILQMRRNLRLREVKSLAQGSRANRRKVFRSEPEPSPHHPTQTAPGFLLNRESQTCPVLLGQKGASAHGGGQNRGGLGPAFEAWEPRGLLNVPITHSLGSLTFPAISAEHS